MSEDTNPEVINEEEEPEVEETPSWRAIQVWARHRPKGIFTSIPKKKFGVWYELRNTGKETILLALAKDPSTGEVETTPVPWTSIPSYPIY